MRLRELLQDVWPLWRRRDQGIVNLNFTDEHGYEVSIEISKPDEGEKQEVKRPFKMGFALPERDA
jgi:hypothetical protein